MDDKKVNLSTIILIFIIFILLIVIFGMWYHYNNLNDEANNTTITNSASNIAISNTNTGISNNGSAENSFKSGNYHIQFDEELLGEEFESSGDEIKGCDYEISFLENNEFTAYMNFGNNISGSYSISNNNIITCTANNFYGEYSPEQEISTTISFKINSNSEIEIVNVPESYKIKTADLNDSGEWALTDEDKDMYLWPLVKGIKFVLSE